MLPLLVALLAGSSLAAAQYEKVITTPQRIFVEEYATLGSKASAYFLTLDSAPTSDVTVVPSAVPGDAIELWQNATFNAMNYAIPQPIFVASTQLVPTDEDSYHAGVVPDVLSDDAAFHGVTVRPVKCHIWRRPYQQ